MSKKKNRRHNTRAEPKQKRSVIGICEAANFDSLECSGYLRLSDSPEVAAGVNIIAQLVGSMTIHLMENTASGDVRVKNELSKKIDINPYRHSTRSQFMEWLVKTLFIEGNGNAVVYPKTERGYLEDLIPVPAMYTSFSPDGIWDYSVYINGTRYSPDDILHFKLNPSAAYPWMGEGPRTSLMQVANNLKQAAATRSGFMKDKWKPSVVIKVDALTEEFGGKDGRKKLLEEYIETSEAGEPWLIPAEQFQVEQVKPLTLNDLAIADSVALDKKTVASILQIPAFTLGVGEFKREEWNNFINTRIMTIAQNIQQVLTKGLIYKPEWYFRFNPRSLYNYDLRDLATIGFDGAARGIITRNESRDWLGLSPMEGLDELVMLENYIPAGMIGDQKKLIQTGGDE